MTLKEYAVYKGEEVIALGTIKEIAEQLGIKERSVRIYVTTAHKNKTKGGNGRRLILLE